MLYHQNQHSHFENGSEVGSSPPPSRIGINNVRFEVSTAVNMIIIIFWEMPPSGSYKNWIFGGSYRLHLQGTRVRAGYRAKL
jgi:hypothetical protein